MFDVCALGELLIDFTPSGTNEQGIALFGRNPGGAPANVLAMNTKFGGKTAFIGKVGADEFGRYLEKILSGAGIDTSGLVRDSKYLTTIAFVQLSESGDRAFSFYRNEGADIMLHPEEVNRAIIDSSKIFHVGSVSLSNEPSRGTVHDSVRYAKQQGLIISYDPNFRPLLWADHGEAKTEIARLIPEADILKVSEEEMLLLTGEEDIKKGAAMLFERGPAIVLVSLGAKGAYFLSASGSEFLQTYDVRTIDTTGAGDAFLGAVHFRLRGKSREELRAITKDELYDIVDFANAAGSLTTTKKGAIPALPSMNETEDLRKRLRR